MISKGCHAVCAGALAQHVVEKIDNGVTMGKKFSTLPTRCTKAGPFRRRWPVQESKIRECVLTAAGNML